jgi:hypothetical protein
LSEANSKSITSFTLGILSIIVPYVGIILGIIGFVFSNQAIKTGQANGLAISGRVLSIVGICIQALLLLLIILAFGFYTVTGFNLE